MSVIGNKGAVCGINKSRELKHSVMSLVNNIVFNTGNLFGELMSDALITKQKLGTVRRYVK